jgi:hypothetical protein
MALQGRLQRHERPLLFAVYGTAAVAALLGQYWVAWGYPESGDWCWIASRWGALRLGLFYGPLAAILVLLGLRAAQVGVCGRTSRSAAPLLVFALSFMMLRLPSILHRAAGAMRPPASGGDQLVAPVGPKDSADPLALAHDLCSPLQGLATASVLLLDRELWRHARPPPLSRDVLRRGAVGSAAGGVVGLAAFSAAESAGVDMYIAAIGEITMSLAVATGACIGVWFAISRAVTGETTRPAAKLYGTVVSDGGGKAETKY